MKNIPNIITGVRIILSIILFFIKPLTLLFFIVYSICGFSDIIDGYIARKTNSTSNFGSLLDSLADIIFMSAAVFAILPIVTIPKSILVWIILIAIVRLISIVVVYLKYHAFAILHTYANKATGLFLFCFPYLFLFVDMTILGYVICTVASLSAVEELILNIKSKKLLRDTKGIFEK